MYNNKTTCDKNLFNTHMAKINESIINAYNDNKLLQNKMVCEKDIIYIIKLYNHYDIDVDVISNKIILLFICMMKIYFIFTKGKPMSETYDKLLCNDKLKI